MVHSLHAHPMPIGVQSLTNLRWQMEHQHVMIMLTDAADELRLNICLGSQRAADATKTQEQRPDDVAREG